jgi:hypothetical protein
MCDVDALHRQGADEHDTERRREQAERAQRLLFRSPVLAPEHPEEQSVLKAGRCRDRRNKYVTLHRL